MISVQNAYVKSVASSQCYFSNENDSEKDYMLLNENKNENEW